MQFAHVSTESAGGIALTRTTERVVCLSVTLANQVGSLELSEYRAVELGLLAAPMLPSLAALPTSKLQCSEPCVPLSADGGERLVTEHEGTSAQDIPA